MTDVIRQTIDSFIHNQNSRTEFRLDSNENYLSGLRLANLGIEDTTGNYQYLSNVGALALIKNVYLYDDSVLVDSCFELGEKWAGFKYLLVDNEYSVGRDKVVATKEYGFQLSDYQNLQAGSVSANTRRRVQFSGESNKSDKKTLVKLAEFLPFLNSVNILNLDNPRVVIEWNIDPNVVFQRNIEHSRPTSFTVSRPYLICDKVINNKFGAMPQKVVYTAWEHDRATFFPAGAVADTPQKVKHRLHGFDGKTLLKCVMSHVDSTQSPLNNRVGNTCSQAQKNMNIQVYINSQPLFPVGINDQNKNHYINDCMGDLNIPMLTNTWSDYNAYDVLDNGVEDLVFTNDWKAFSVGHQIPDLQIEASRTTTARTLAPVHLHLFGLVKKVYDKQNKDVSYL